MTGTTSLTTSIQPPPPQEEHRLRRQQKATVVTRHHILQALASLNLEETPEKGQAAKLLAPLVDHSYLPSVATMQAQWAEQPQAVARFCHEALYYHFFGVCLRPEWVAPARHWLSQQPQGSTLPLSTVIGFPNGPMPQTTALSDSGIGTTPLPEIQEQIRQALADGADELDWVFPLHAWKQQDRYSVEEALHGSLQSLQGETASFKIIIETTLLHDAELREIVSFLGKQLETHASIDRVYQIKTCTGMVSGTEKPGATPADVRQIRDTLDEQGLSHIQIKASGGIHSLEQAVALVLAGADRLGSSGAMQWLVPFLEQPAH
ncbi:MAG: hypothetical protein SFZ03_07420 [Candidatus Melainabacteria bacterium]|nr:hypothetical protein [Candidatus Melainabacteria bacterium]